MSWIDELGPTIENAGPWDRPAAVTLEGGIAAWSPDLASQADELWQEMIRDDASLRQWQYLAGMGPSTASKIGLIHGRPMTRSQTTKPLRFRCMTPGH